MEQKQMTPLTSGLCESQVLQRMKKGQSNKVNDRITKTYTDIMKDNLCTLFNLINGILAALIICIGSFKNVLFLGVVLSNIVIGIVQEIRAKQILDKLALITKPYVAILRDGSIQNHHMEQLVLDDIVVLSAGSQICADAIVSEGMIEVNESLVTGESDTIVKKVGDEILSGSFVVSGRALVQVIHVGQANYAQTIMCDAKKYKKHKSQIRDSINFIIKCIGFIIIPLGILLFCKQLFITHADFDDAIVTTVAALLGMIPEGLVLLTSIALAVGAVNLARRHTLVQELYCIETLARVDVLCLDKTGTITEGNMRLEKLITLHTHTISNEDILANMMSVLDDHNATAIALRHAFPTCTHPLQALHTLPFSSQRKRSAVTFLDAGTFLLGAYEYVHKEKNEEVEAIIQHHASLGNRVLVLAHSMASIQDEKVYRDNTILALLILSDPIRKEAAKTLDYFLAQGVEIKIISGDDPQTVHEIARKAHLKNHDSYIDMSKVQEEDIPTIASTYTVFGRVSPQQKKSILHALKEKGHITAMIGDGVNDVMALKEADCSISVAEGSEAAKNIANLVLLDNNFANMPHIVDEGRRVINNIQRASSMFLVKTTFSTMLSILTLFFMRNYPFQPIHLTLISAVTIGIPSFFLALEANHARVEGNFLLNVLGRAMPGALCVVLSILYVNVLSFFFQFDTHIVSTMCVLLTAACLLIVLYRVSTPFTKKRFILFVTMTTLFILAVVFAPHAFSMVSLTLFQLIVTLAGMVAIPFVMDFIFRFASHFKLKQRIAHIGE